MARYGDCRTPARRGRPLTPVRRDRPLAPLILSLSKGERALSAEVASWANVLIGCSGWSYAHWNKTFYPDKLPADEHLPFYAEHFATVEINYSFYRLPPRKTFELWRRKSPAKFVFAVKASRYLTHMKKLKDPQEPLQRALEHAAGLGSKLGPVLFQFPRGWKVNLERLSEFLTALEAHPRRRYAFEFRNQSWLTAEVYERLKASKAALCLPIGWEIPLDIQLTARWTYLRFHGGEHGVSFQDDELEPWAEHIRAWRRQGIDSYSYFNNDTVWQGRPAAIDNARRLRELVER